MLIAVCLLSGLALPVLACGKEARLQPIHDPRVQVYFDAYRMLEADLGMELSFNEHPEHHRKGGD
jgi:hypothetical protein